MKRKLKFAHRNRKEIPIQQRFFKYIRKTKNCWIWTASTNIQGYGRLGYGRRKDNPKKIAAHRLSWKIHRGEIPIGKFVLHKCDNPICVNPKHLYIGSARDNSRDMVKRRRHCFGENKPTAKLKSYEVKEIREICKHGIPQIDIAKAYGVCQFSISLIHRKVNWRLV